MGEILKGKELRKLYCDQLRLEVKNYVDNKGIIPCLTSILVGNDGGSIFYVDFQKKICEEVGIKYNLIHLDENIEEQEIINNIVALNKDSKVHGIMLQVPLPKHLDEKNIISYIDAKKDVDSLTDCNLGRLFKGEKCFEPCTPKAVVEIIKSTNIDIEGKRVVIVGRSNIVGKPLAIMLLRNNATVTICHSKTKNLSEVTKEADILISCVGVPEMIKKDYIKEGAMVIDVGTSNVNGKMKGDVDFDDVKDKSSYITPVPGGVGSVTTMMLLKNTMKAIERI